MQRVVAGTLRGRRLLSLPKAVSGVRPSSSRVRGAIFDRLQREVVGARVLDLFAGSGALAIEALSRGAAHATLVERQAGLTRFLAEQLAALEISARAQVIHDDARRFLSRDRGAQAAFDLVLVDPPYAELDLYGEVLTKLVEADPRTGASWLAPEAVIVVEYHKHKGRRPAIVVPAGLVSEAVRDHGQTALEFFERASQA
ncbi:16S rRNA (guanine(966)-N(2))-methyltransferase RsmD [Pseudenhygromyxa sp. WMMC2535]|nr:16S rRNA (guanine(966)-N(2))-methyltransferase RsmD [Pseudenhygromyxa sp. WMMC2535]NVB39918.1 16S rRNA (guanine(966)-N(2))-methyltransferase RsmD [Pseudenhygromyxa sp. WMMC2535]